jgi:hypothetical protein
MLHGIPGRRIVLQTRDRCALLTGRRLPTVVAAAWTVGLAVILGLPDGIWATGTRVARVWGWSGPSTRRRSASNSSIADAAPAASPACPRQVAPDGQCVGVIGGEARHRLPEQLFGDVPGLPAPTSEVAPGDQGVGVVRAEYTHAVGQHPLEGGRSASGVTGSGRSSVRRRRRLANRAAYSAQVRPRSMRYAVAWANASCQTPRSDALGEAWPDVERDHTFQPLSASSRGCSG